ncbi:MAG: phosphoribosylaminoimidazolesuccinocarboxamide synthase [Candidatus Saganbacteria bacterium]|nr:phosphoribosylaminoimidazolesuccinocarboxamide synthase [Candidatus Saganbacteria bacterium]
MRQTVYNTDFPKLKLFNRGKVRDIYDLGENLLIVATDRLSAFDIVMPNPIPRKGEVLTKISLFWFDALKDIIENHLISADPKNYPKECREYADNLKDRSMLVKRSKPLPVECIVRGYISGSGWKDYKTTGTISGIKLPKDLKESDKLPEPIFTPSTKEEVGTHDQTIDFERTKMLLGNKTAKMIKEASIALYNKASEIAAKKGIIISDTKFEFGFYNDEIILIDEVLTPDSSRFWPKDDYKPGRPQKSFDKQFTRDYLLSIKWDQKPPAPELPEEIISKTSEKYIEALNRLTA